MCVRASGVCACALKRDVCVGVICVCVRRCDVCMQVRLLAGLR